MEMWSRLRSAAVTGCQGDDPAVPRDSWNVSTSVPSTGMQIVAPCDRSNAKETQMSDHRLYG